VRHGITSRNISGLNVWDGRSPASFPAISPGGQAAKMNTGGAPFIFTGF